MPTKFSFADDTYTINITWWDAISVYPEKFNLELLKLMADDEITQIIIGRITLDDSLIVDLMWHFIQPESSFDHNDFVQKLSTKAVSDFREAFWKEVAFFSGPLKEPALLQGWKEAKRFLKKATFDFSHLDSNPEESTSED